MPPRLIFLIPAFIGKISKGVVLVPLHCTNNTNLQVVKTFPMKQLFAMILAVSLCGCAVAQQAPQVQLLSKELLPQLHRHVIAAQDPTGLYQDPAHRQELFYYALVPPGPIKGAIVLLPGTWDSLEYVLDSNNQLLETAYAQGIATIVVSVNQHLSLADDVLQLMNSSFRDAIERYHIPKDKFVIGGFSMGGLFSLRYAELAKQDPSKTAIVPAAAYSVDGPTDLENLYRHERRQLVRLPGSQEPAYAIREFHDRFGGSPDTVQARYIYYSTYSHDQPDGGNAKYLADLPVRIYNDVDVNWWLDNRGQDLYEMNALDQSALINYLHDRGNKRAEFINAFKKGYRLEGQRHPHSWSIVDAKDCVAWVEQCIQ